MVWNLYSDFDGLVYAVNMFKEVLVLYLLYYEGIIQIYSP